VPAHKEEAGWKVRFTANGYLWEIVDPEGKVTPLDDSRGLYNPKVNNIPRCYTFLPAVHGKPIRLAVGHTWGLSLYECRPGHVRLARLMVGHEGEVMAVAPSIDGKLLVTASRDQTIAGWSLEDWPHQGELGAGFEKDRKTGKLMVKDVALGSPAWELGVTPGDEIITLVASASKFAYNVSGKDLKELGIGLPGKGTRDLEKALAELRGAQPSQELIVYWKTPRGEILSEKTTVRQRPLWRFFPTRPEKGNEYVLWRWRDYYYDTNSATADSLLGWHVNTGNQGIGDTPQFYPLERFRQRFHKPGKVWATVRRGLYQPDKVIFADIEPPSVKVTAGAKDLRDQDLVLKVEIRSGGGGVGQRIDRIFLWLDDYRYPGEIKVDGKGEVAREIRIPQRMLRRGANRILLQAFNASGARGQDVVSITYRSKDPETKPVLHGLCVGIGDYSRVKGDVYAPPLQCPPVDARDMADMLRRQEGTSVYRKAEVNVIDEARATSTEILERLEKLRERNLPRNDWLVLFLSGHGVAEAVEDDPDGRERRPDSFYFLCADTNMSRADTKLFGWRLADALSRLPCNKLIVLDACHSGAVASNPIRALTPEGVRFLIVSSCRTDQKSFEPGKGDTSLGKNGLFTRCFLEAIEKSPSRVITGQDLSGAIRNRLDTLLHDIRARARDNAQKNLQQTPVFLPEPLPPVPIFARR
jgi:hypothetical protein